MSDEQNVAHGFDGQSIITGNLVEKLTPLNSNDFDPVERTKKASELELVLLTTQQAFHDGKEPASIVERLAGSLHLLRRSTDPVIWKSLIPQAQQHPVREYLFQDPFTQWSFSKPRGYSGDAGLLDIFYKHPSAQHIIDEASDLGRDIYDYTSDASTSVAGRERREILAQIVDDTAQRVDDAEVLAVACGNMREAELSTAFEQGTLKRWVGLDQDPMSIATVNASYGGRSIQTVEGSVKGLLRRAYKLGRFDLIYASGLYDYLPEPVGVRLLQRMCELLKPQGELLFANYSDEITTDGYMETFMDWPLLLRNEDDMWTMINAAIDRNVYDAEVYYGGNRNIVYGKLTKKH